MKLFVSPGACSMSCHIAFEEAGLKFDAVISNEAEVNKLNPLHAVPVLQFNDGKVLTQNIAILTYAANTPEGSKLLPKPGTFEFAKAYQWLSFVASDLHPSFSPLWDDSITPEARTEAVTDVCEYLAYADKELANKSFIAGNEFTIADAYLFTVYSWTKFVKIDTAPFANLNAYSTRIYQRPAVQKVMAREGLLN